MTKRRRFRVIAVATFIAAVPLTGCGAQNQPSGQNLPEFGSIDEAYTAVDKILGCEPDPIGEPTVPMGDGVRLTSAQKLCFENVQIDLYTDQKALQESYQILSDTNQGKVHLVHGKNRMVVDFSQMATGQPPTRSIERLATELNGEYAIVGV
ncbi:hypothetical protein HTS88_18745 [Pseudarthrobacter oxydans]|uniref:hypothetical protein n=1 Tax=Pseudarthrobacter oxydans TaxID=1671 RepID=UPI0015733922|nr:hypothetical protein [Pseudarthrobacter oxydans]MBD1540411.1 hypothetical protein [Arthrobacter sp. S13_S34]NSX38425.1 hypothetical protein [Pseudarthrobacter oxydans]